MKSLQRAVIFEVGIHFILLLLGGVLPLWAKVIGSHEREHSKLAKTIVANNSQSVCSSFILGHVVVQDQTLVLD